jgi:16S rRNA (cytidine1402-2'-O)-methyltransferase
MSGSLILVPTPIGNLGDISPRAVEALNQADFIAAEDTRVSLKLLNHLEIKKQLVSYHEHNKMESGPHILARLQAGETCALVTDAGTPAISDPGEDLVRLCAENGIPVTAIPGPCAVITALAISGLPTGRFTFEGFLSMNKRSRREHLASLTGEQRTMVFYEAPHKLIATLEDLEKAFGPDRRICLCRELTKLHEEALRMTLSEAIAYYREKSPRGEYVLVLEGAKEAVQEQPSQEDALAQVLALRSQGLSLKDAVKQVSKALGIPKNALYDAALQAEE